MRVLNGSGGGGVILRVRFQTTDLPPEIIRQPLDVEGIERVDSAGFTVEVRSASPVSYTWRFNGVEIPGANTSTLSFNRVRLNQAGTYSVLIRNNGGSVESLPARLTVHARPVNDDFADRTALVGGDVDATGASAYATREDSAGEPGGIVDFPSVWWSWTSPRDGYGVVDLAGSREGTLLDLFTGGRMPDLVSVPTLLYQNSDATYRARFAASAGTTYQVRVLNGAGGGDVALKIRLGTTDSPPEIVDQPADTEVIQGQDSPGFSVEARSVTPLGYQWRFNGLAIPGANSSRLVFDNVRLDQAGIYSVLVNNGGGTVESRSARLNIHSRPANDDFADRITLTGTTASGAGTSLYATREDAVGEPLGVFPYPSVWWTWTAPKAGFVIVDLAGSLDGTVGELFAGEALAALETVPVLLEQNADATSRARLFSEAGRTYQVRVLNGTGGGSVNLGIRLLPTDLPPAIASQPADLEVIERQDSPGFQVEARSVASTSFQWRFNGGAFLTQ